MAIGPAAAWIGHKYSPQIHAPVPRKTKPAGTGILESLLGRKKRERQVAPRGVMPWPMRAGVPMVLPGDMRAMPTNVRYVSGRPVAWQVPVRRIIDPRFVRPVYSRPGYLAPQMRLTKPKKRTLGQRTNSVGRLIFGNLWSPKV